MRYPLLPAVIVEIPCRENSYSYLVSVEGQGSMFLRGLGAPRGTKIGDRGTVQYTVGSSYGLYFWKTASCEECESEDMIREVIAAKRGQIRLNDHSEEDGSWRWR